MNSIHLIADFILVTGLVVTLIILFSLIKAPKKELHQRILILLFIYMLTVTLAFYSDLHGIDLILVLTFIFQDHVEFMAGPLLYIYIKSFYEKSERLIRNHLAHFIPLIVYTFAISTPILVSILIGRPLFEYIGILMKNQDRIFPPHAPYLLMYCLLSLNLLKKYRQKLRLNYSSIGEKDLTWIKHLLLGILVVISIDLCTTIYEISVRELDWDTGYLTVFAMVAMIIYLGHYGASQSRILLPSFLLDVPAAPVPFQEKKIAQHHLANVDKQEIQTLKTRLLEILETEKPYLNEDLTLGSLAELIPTTDKKLSALLNHHIKISFYDLINKYRVEEVKSKMADSAFENYTLLSIAFDCGFKSKTSFNRTFKKATGRSPSEYKKQL